MAPAACGKSMSDNPAKATVRHDDDRLQAPRLLLQPVASGIGAADELVIAPREQTIAPLYMTAVIPDVDWKRERDPPRRLEPDLSKQWRHDDLVAGSQALRGCDRARQIARAEEIGSGRRAQEIGGWRGVVANPGGVVRILESPNILAMHPSAVVDVRGPAVPDEQQTRSHDGRI